MADSCLLYCFVGDFMILGRSWD